MGISSALNLPKRFGKTLAQQFQSPMGISSALNTSNRLVTFSKLISFNPPWGFLVH